MGYDIYDTDAGNLWSSFATEEEALDEVRRAITESGEDSIASWSMGRSDHVGKAIFGEALIARALRPVIARPR